MAAVKVCKKRVVCKLPKVRVDNIWLCNSPYYVVTPRREVSADGLGLLRFQLTTRIHVAIHLANKLEEARSGDNDSLMTLGGRSGIVEGLVEEILAIAGLEVKAPMRVKKPESPRTKR